MFSCDDVIPDLKCITELGSHQLKNSTLQTQDCKAIFP